MPSERDSSSGGSHNGKTLTRRGQSGPLANQDVLSKTKHEEWTTSKKVVNHKTKQVETRVQRQIIMEDGKVIADSGPQVTTKTTEDNKTEETENTQHKTDGDNEAQEGYKLLPGPAKVVSEKTESHQTMKESKEECRQMHDESLQELSGRDFHQKALVAPGDFGRELDTGRPFRGKLTHFSSKSQKITDKEEVKETSEQDHLGQVTTNTTRTHHHEEIHDDEVPEDQADGPGAAGQLRAASPQRRIEYKPGGVGGAGGAGQSPAERRDAVTKKALSVEEEEEIRNCETNRWLEDHFGSDSSSEVVEATRTRAGGNVISIQMSSGGGRKASSPPAEVLPGVVASRVQQLSANASSTTRFARDSHVRSTSPAPPRGARSPANDDYSTLSGKMPITTYYLGQEGSYHVRHMTPRFESTPLRKSSWKSSPSLHDQTGQTETSSFYRSRRELEEEEEERRRRQRSPVQRSMSQRDIFQPRPRQPPSSRDDALVHKISLDSSWKSTPPRDRHHRKEYSEVHAFRRGNKTDRSVQVVLSDDDDDTTDYSTLSRRLSPSPDQVLYARPRTFDSLRRPSARHFYFGEGSANGTSEGYSSLPSNRYGSLEREDSIDRRYSVYSPLDGHRSPPPPPQPPRRTSAPVGYNGSPSFDDRARRRSSPERRQRPFYSNVAPSPPRSSPPHSPAPHSPPPRLIRADRFGGSCSLSPPDSPVAPPPPPPPPGPEYGKGSWSRDTRGRAASPPLNPPSFKPLLSPVEIRNMANSFGDRRRSEVTSNGKGPVVVQIRDWGNR